MSNISYKSCTLLWNAKKEKYLHEISIFTLIKKFFPGLPNLGAQIRCAQNWYTAVQTDLKYPLDVYRMLFLALKKVQIVTPKHTPKNTPK